jgi:acetolactate synthase I/III small subunit
MHTIIALLQDHPGVLHRVLSLFRRRAYNIASLTVGQCELPDVSRMTVVVDADSVEQVTKQLNRLIEVLKVQDVTDERTVERETVLIKMQAPAAARAGLIALTGSHGAKVVDVGTSTLVFELTDTPDKVAAFVDLLRPLGVKEMIRSGRIAMVRGQAPAGSVARAPTARPSTAAAGFGEAEPSRSQGDGAS